MNVLVCGSRDFGETNSGWWNECVWINSYLSGIYQFHDIGWNVVHRDPFVIIEGGARGADMIARDWAVKDPLHGPFIEWEVLEDEQYLGDPTPVSLRTFPAYWNSHPRNGCEGYCSGADKGYCSHAGPMRNARMLSEGKPDLVLAFINKSLSQSRGTHDMVRRAKSVKVKTITVEVPAT